MREGLFVEGLEDDVQALVEEGAVACRVAPVRGGMEVGAGAAVDARRDSEVHPTLGHLVEEGDVLRDPQRVPVRQHHAALAHPKARTRSHHIGAEQHRIRRGAVPAVPRELVFGEPYYGIAERVHQLDGLVHLVEE